MARKKILKSKKQILDTALALIDTEGVASVSMIRLSKELGVSSMTLYNYVRNADEVLREILVQTFSGFYEQVYLAMSGMDRGAYRGVEAYAIAYAAALYDLSEQRREICRYLIGEGYVKYYNDAELRRFYNPLGVFLLDHVRQEEVGDWKDAFRLYKCVVFSLIHEHMVGGQRLSKDEYLRNVTVFMRKVFPQDTIRA